MRNLIFDRKVIEDYINGNTLEEYTEVELEDNMFFMNDVLAVTKDSKMFYFASDKVRNNIDFVVKAIKTLKDDEKFVSKVYDEFSSKNPDYRQVFIIYLYNMYRNDNCEFARRMTVEADKVFNELDVDGTFASLSKSCDNPVKLEFMARKYATKLFYDNEKYTLEGLLHHTMTTKEKRSIKPSTFTMRYISNHDGDLAAYISIKPDMISGIFKDVKDAFRNWDAYENRLNDIRIKNVIGILYNYVKDSNNIEVSPQSLLSYIIYDLSLQESFEMFETHNPIKGLKYKDYKDNHSKVDRSKLPKTYADLEDKISKIYKKDYVGERKK